MLDRLYIEKKVKEFLLEDIYYQDITTDNLAVDREITAQIIAKEEGILAGIDIAEVVFKTIDPQLTFTKYLDDGSVIQKGQVIAKITGKGKAILKGERVALNLLQRLSGIATNTKRFVNRIKHTKAKLLDTRKTTPGLRAFEKYAVRVGGAYNHRFGLFDMAMVKDNHIALAGGLKQAVEDIRQKISPMAKLEVEVSSIDMLKEALQLNVDVIMLDNFSVEDVQRAVEITKGKKQLEASGNITIDNIKQYAETGVDFISSGALIHSARWLDISLKFS
ncbi:MAG: carboxylating nicotinate-nucleotide diphosphorylase [Aquificae bacterium]|nr:carboxylating nicotinate-nucleotide diphosphorylase [Aquificota bacterium]